MKVLLSIVSAIGVIGCVVLGVFFTSARGEADKANAELAAAQAQLTVVQAELDDSETSLDRAQRDLNDAEADLNAATEELSATELELTQAKMDLTDTTHQLDLANTKYTNALESYEGMRLEIFAKTGIGEYSQKYITPEDPAVITKARQIAGPFSENNAELWRDYKRLYDWVVDNIEYSYDTNIPLLPEAGEGYIEWFAEYWKTPAETLADGVGDCEDMANLLASLILAYNEQRYGIGLIELQGYDSGHLAVGIPVQGGNLVILDPAGHYYSGMPSSTVQSADIATAIYQWLDYWRPDMPGVQVAAAFSLEFYEEFSSTSQFIDWAIEQFSAY